MLISLLQLKVCSSIPNNIVSTKNLFADDIPIFPAVNYANISADELNKDLQKIPNGSIDGKWHSIPDLRSDFF